MLLSVSLSIGSTLPFGVVMAYISIYWFNRFIFWPRIFSFTLFAICAFFLMGTFSRGAQGMLLIGMTSCLFFRFCVGGVARRVGQLNLMGIVSFILASVVTYFLVFLILPSALLSRIKNIFNWSTEVSNFNRVKAWGRSLSSLKIILIGYWETVEHPVTYLFH